MSEATKSKVAKNDITGDSIQTKSSSQRYRDNWEKIFGKKNSKDSTEKRKSPSYK
jgi:hypothetical protein